MNDAAAPVLAARPRAFDAVRIATDFPILARPIYGRRLVFLDSAASAQKPQVVIDAVRRAYEKEYANIHRGVYWLSQRATEAFEGARAKVARFLNAREDREIIFVRNATEAINLVAATYGRSFLKPGDEVLITHMEHHSNIVPWQMLRDEKGIVLQVAPIDDRGALDLDATRALIGPRTKLVAVTQVANALGTVVPVAEIVALAHAAGAKVLIDGSQAVQHMAVDVQALDCDFFVFTGHKLYGPTGIGVLYGKAKVLESMPPYQGGGDMIRSVTFDKTEYNEIPSRFEAGTPHIVGAIGLGAAIDYVTSIGLDRIAAHEAELLAYGDAVLAEVPGLRMIGRAPHRAAVFSFVLEGVHPHDVGTILDREAIAVRTGHHCAQPVMDRFCIPATVRASLGMYNTRADIDALAAGLRKVREVFA